MKYFFSFPILLLMLLVQGNGCSSQLNEGQVDRNLIAEGIIYSVQYKLTEEPTGGFTRASYIAAISGQKVQTSKDAYGRLYEDYLEITYPHLKSHGPRLIPVSRLIDIQFGDHGIQFGNKAKKADSAHSDDSHPEK